MSRNLWRAMSALLVASSSASAQVTRDVPAGNPVATINLVPLAADHFGWRYAFLVLAPGPVVGAVAMAVLPGLATSTTAQKENTDDHQFPESLRAR